MGRMSRGWELTKLCFRVLRQDKELLLFPVISGVATIAIWLSYFGFLFVFDVFDSSGTIVYVSAAMGFVFYLVTYFIAIFFNAAIVGAAMIRLNGGDPTLSDGIRVAASRMKEIFLWAIFSATVSIILRMIAEKFGDIGRLVAGLAGIAWSVATYFAVPVIIYEGVGPWQAVKRSVAILRQAWGEALVGNLGMGGIFFLMALAGLVPLVIGYLSGSFLLLILCIVVAVVYWVFIGILSSAMTSILLAALYRYAVTGKISEDFSGVVPPPAHIVSSPGYPYGPGA